MSVNFVLPADEARKQELIQKYDLAVRPEPVRTGKKVAKEAAIISRTTEEIIQRIKNAGNTPSSAHAAFYLIKYRPYNPNNHTELETGQLDVLETASRISKNDPEQPMTDKELEDTFELLGNDISDMQEEIEKLPKEEQKAAHEGIFRALENLINLPKYAGKSEGNQLLRQYLEDMRGPEKLDFWSREYFLKSLVNIRAKALVPVGRVKSYPVPQRPSNLPAISVVPVTEYSRINLPTIPEGVEEADRVKQDPTEEKDEMRSEQTRKPLVPEQLEEEPVSASSSEASKK